MEREKETEGEFATFMNQVSSISVILWHYGSSVGLWPWSESNSSHVIIFTFRLMPLRKDMNPFLPNYELNSITALFLQGWLWHWITHKSWYAIKQRKWKKAKSKLERHKPSMVLGDCQFLVYTIIRSGWIGKKIGNHQVPLILCLHYSKFTHTHTHGGGVYGLIVAIVGN